MKIKKVGPAATEALNRLQLGDNQILLACALQQTLEQGVLIDPEYLHSMEVSLVREESSSPVCVDLCVGVGPGSYTVRVLVPLSDLQRYRNMAKRHAIPEALDTLRGIIDDASAALLQAREEVEALIDDVPQDLMGELLETLGDALRSHADEVSGLESVINACESDVEAFFLE